MNPNVNVLCGILSTALNFCNFSNKKLEERLIYQQSMRLSIILFKMEISNTTNITEVLSGSQAVIEWRYKSKQGLHLAFEELPVQRRSTSPSNHSNTWAKYISNNPKCRGSLRRGGLIFWEGGLRIRQPATWKDPWMAPRLIIWGMERIAVHEQQQRWKEWLG